MLRIVQRLFAPVAIACLAWFAWQARDDLAALVAGTQTAYLVLAAALWCLSHLLAPLVAMLVFGARGRTVGYATAARIHFEYLPARYVPGGIWHTVGRVAAFRKLGLDASDLSTFVILENALALATALALGGAGIAAIRGPEIWGLIGALAALGGLVLLVALPVLLKSKALRVQATLPAKLYLGIVAIACLYWLVAAAAFTAYVSAYASLAAQLSLLETGAAYLLSWGIGFLAVFAPQGIGVFEVAAAELIRGAASLVSVTALLAGFRLVILVADVVMWGAGRVLTYRIASQSIDQR